MYVAGLPFVLFQANTLAQGGLWVTMEEASYV
jgi:hypothetical protein